MKYDLTMLHGKQDLKEFQDRFGIETKAINRLAYVADVTHQILFYVDAVEDQPFNGAENTRSSDFELIVMINQLDGELEEYAKSASTSFLSAIGELDRVYRRFLTATEMIEIPNADEVPVAVFNILRGLMAGVGMKKIT